MIALLSTDRMAQLRALVLIAMERAGAGAKKQEMEQIMDREDGLAVRKGAVDLGFVWRRLLVLGIKELEVAMVVAQMALYVNQKMQAPMVLPAEVGAAVEGALERLGDPSAFMDELEQAVLALAPAQKEKVQQAATRSAERPKVLLDPPAPTKSDPGKAKAEPAKTTKTAKAEPVKAAKAEPAKAEPAKASSAPASRTRRKGPPVSNKGILVAALIAVILVGGGLTLATQSDQTVPADAPLPTAQLAALIPLKEASVKNGVLQIAASGKEFDALDPGTQESKAAEMFRLLKGRNVMVVELKTPEHEYKILKNESGGAMVLRLEPPEEEVPLEGAEGAEGAPPAPPG